MNPDDPLAGQEIIESNPDSMEPPVGKQPVIPWLMWARRLLLCNPFYLCSAGMLLYAINRLSTDPNFLSDETQNLLFNFAALEVYELMLVGTGIVLAARRIWYDSALLVVLENGLVLMPFMLVSHATFVDKGLAWALTLVAATAAIGRLFAVRRLYTQFRLPRRLLLFGAIILGLNVGLPHLFRWWVEADLEAWARPNMILWFIAMPLLAAAANLLPRPTQYGGLNPERSWLPLFNYGLWIGGTCVHLWCLNYISRVPFAWLMVAPTAWACAWTMFHRLSDCLPNPPPGLRKAVLGLAFLTPLLAMPDASLFAALGALNAAGFLVLCRVTDSALRRTAVELALLSAALTFSGWPLEWFPPLNRAEHVAAAGALYCIILAFRSTDPRIGLVGALALAGAVAWLVRDWTLHAAVQASCMFLLGHSVRWTKDAGPGAQFLRSVTSVLWMLDAIVWTGNGTLAASSCVAGGAVGVSALWSWQYQRTGVRPPLIIPAAAALTFATGPCNWFYSTAPAGIIALAASVVFFAIGTLIAWYRNNIVSHPVPMPGADQPPGV